MNRPPASRARRIATTVALVLAAAASIATEDTSKRHATRTEQHLVILGPERRTVTVVANVHVTGVPPYFTGSPPGTIVPRGTLSALLRIDEARKDGAAPSDGRVRVTIPAGFGVVRETDQSYPRPLDGAVDDSQLIRVGAVYDITKDQAFPGCSGDVCAETISVRLELVGDGSAEVDLSVSASFGYTAGDPSTPVVTITFTEGP